MPEIGEALILAGLGMGLVFFSLAIFTLLVLALTRFINPDKLEVDEQIFSEQSRLTKSGAEVELAAIMGVALALGIRSTNIRISNSIKLKGNAWKLQGREDVMKARMIGR
jgi:Na+-transporting methylmalonyl-CoA/oxaloacetate decarboxylase gamma subunit